MWQDYPFASPLNMLSFQHIFLASFAETRATNRRSVTNFLLNTEIVPLCLRIMENGGLVIRSGCEPGNLYESMASAGNLWESKCPLGIEHSYWKLQIYSWFTMIYLFRMVIFQVAMLVYQRVTDILSWSSWKLPVPVPGRWSSMAQSISVVLPSESSSSICHVPCGNLT